MTRKPAVSLVAVAGRRRATLELAQRLEAEGFGGIYCPSPGDGLALAEALALVTREIPLGTSIANIYTRHALEYAQAAALIHELSGGRFHFGVGVSHGPTLQGYAGQVGALPPVVLATLRRRMVELAGEIARGAVWANAARSHMKASLAHLPASARQDPGFFVGDMIPTCVDEDRGAAAALMRRVLAPYARLPNYRNYWREAGYAEEMDAIEAALTRGEEARVPGLMSDRWLRDVTLFGPAAEVREGVEAWRAAGVRTVILVPSSTRGGQMAAFEELVGAFR
jgi:alkanesulfonate monooxygenase SsuD/methylene tetrahydromethanopterin reductase-like flavin-dependent oxidoreductase (luciferase family)